MSSSRVPGTMILFMFQFMNWKYIMVLVSHSLFLSNFMASHAETDADVPLLGFFCSGQRNSAQLAGSRFLLLNPGQIILHILMHVDYAT